METTVLNDLQGANVLNIKHILYGLPFEEMTTHSILLCS